MTETVHWSGHAVEADWEWTEEDDARTGETRRSLRTTSKLHELSGSTVGTVSRSVTWEAPGLWFIFAVVERTKTRYCFRQEVVPRSEIISRSKAWPETHADPQAAAEWGRETLDAMDAVAAARPAMDDATKRRHAAQRLQLRQYLDGLDKLLFGVPPSMLSFIRGTWVARTVDDIADDVVEVRGVLFKTVSKGQAPRWTLVDWTNPTCSRRLAVHTGQMMDDAASISAAIASWKASNQFPAGTIEFEVDGLAGYHLVTAHDDPDARKQTISTTDDFALLASDILGWVSMGTFVLGLVAAATGVGVVAAPALLAVSAASGAASGGTHLVYLINVGSDNWRAYAFDALSIAGNVLGLRGGAFKLFGTAPIKIGGAKATKYVVMGEMLTNGAELVLVAESTHNELGKLADDPTKTPQEKVQDATKLIGTALGTSALLVWSARQSAKELKNIENFLKSAIDPDPSWRGHIEGGKDPAETQDMVVHSAKRVPDQALLYHDVRELRVGAAHAVDVVHGSAKAGPGVTGWVEGRHWKAWAGKTGKSGAAGVLQLPDGRVVPGRSHSTLRRALERKMKAAGGDSASLYTHIRNEELRQAYAAVEERGRGHGGCAEIFMLDDALDSIEVNELRGALSDVRLVRKRGSDATYSAALPACDSCQHVLARFGIVDVNSIRRGLMKVPSATLKEYLKRLGLPGNWVRADEAIEKLTQAGFPVSAAAQEMLRRFGDLDSLRNRPPAPAKTPDVRHTPARICIDPFNVLTEGETVAEVEEELGVQGLCAIGYCSDGGIMCIAEDGTVWFSESAFGYAGSTPDEVIERLLEGRPNR